MKISSQKKRFLIIVLAVLAFLPPLAFIPRFFGSLSICGSPFCMRMLLSFEGFSAMSKTLFMGLYLIAAIFIVSFIAGRFWCSHVCPVGGITEIGSKAVPDKLKINYRWISAPAVRYSYLAAFLLLPVLGVGSLCCSYCNFSIISSLFGSVTNPSSRVLLAGFGGITDILLLLLLGIFAVGGRAYCNFLCPVGSVDAIFNWLGSKIRFLKRIRINQSKCNSCNQCIKACPMWAIEKQSDNSVKINQLSCIPCKICIEKCQQDAISYQKEEYLSEKDLIKSGSVYLEPH
ncbi:MAG: 4Fe-4S binding protein [Bacteroidales bacterium]